MTTATTEEEKQQLCVVTGCGRKHKAHGLCSPHYLRQRAGKSLMPPIGKKDQEVAINSRVTLEVKAILLTLAEGKDKSFYQYMSDVLAEHARHWQGSVDEATVQSHLAGLKRDLKRRKRERERFEYAPRGEALG